MTILRDNTDVRFTDIEMFEINSRSRLENIKTLVIIIAHTTCDFAKHALKPFKQQTRFYVICYNKF